MHRVTVYYVSGGSDAFDLDEDAGDRAVALGRTLWVTYGRADGSEVRESFPLSAVRRWTTDPIPPPPGL